MIENRSYTTIEFADDVMQTYDSGMYDTWQKFTTDQKTSALNVAALQLEIGYRLPLCIKTPPVPYNLQLANVLVIQGFIGGIAQQFLEEATSVTIDVLRVTRGRNFTTDPNSNPFKGMVDDLMKALGFLYAGNQNMRITDIKQVG